MDIIRHTNLTLGVVILPFLLGLATVLLFVWNSSRKQRYWKKIGLPYAKTYPLVGSVFELWIKTFHDLELERYFKLGRMYGHYEGDKALISVSEPELLRSILVKDFHAFTGRRLIQTGDKIFEKMLSIIQGEDWKRIRTIVTPTFTTGKIKKMLSIFKDCSSTLVRNFKEASKNGEPFEVKSLFGAFTMDIIASSAFSTKIDSHNDPNNKFVTAARTIFSRNINWRFIVFTLFPGIIKLFRINVFNTKVRDFFTSATLEIMEQRKRTGQTRNDFLQLLMDTAKDVEREEKLDHTEKDITENYGEVDNNQIFKNTYAKKTLSLEELIAQCIIFFLAGYDTTASTLSFVCYNLALNPDIQEKLIQEVDDVLRDNNGELTYEAIQSMKYLDNVISETLRMFPPAARLERRAEEDYVLGDTGLTIPKGMIVTIPVYAIHRDPKFFPEPEKFDPDRFTPEERANRNPYTYIPFGAGPRNCIGMRFALVEIKVCLVHVLINFRIKRCSETKVPLEWYRGQGLLQPKGIKLLMEERKDTAKAL